MRLGVNDAGWRETELRAGLMRTRQWCSPHSTAASEPELSLSIANPH